ncbi:MATE family efflux transporter [soil metagenome]
MVFKMNNASSLVNNIATPKTVSFQHISKRIASLSLPMALSQLINFASAFLCTAMLAQLGQEVLAASALMISTQISLMVTAISLLLALSVLVGHAYGAKNYSAIGIFLQLGWILALFISLPLIFIYLHLDKILLYFGQSPSIVIITQQYFHVSVLNVVPCLLAVCNQQFGYGIRKVKLMILISFLSVLVLLPTAYALILGKWGLPQLGVAGLAYAQLAQNTFYLLATTACFYWGKSFKHFDLFTYRAHKNWRSILQMFKIGWPISLQMSGEMLAFFVSAIMVGWIGTTALAAYQVVNQYLFLVIVPVFALSQATGILISHACGAGNYHEVKKLGDISLYLILIICSMVAAIFLLMPHSLAAIYLNTQQQTDVATIQLVVVLFTIVAFSQVFDGIRNVLTGALRGIFDTRFAMLIGLLVLWGIGMPLSYVLAFPLHYGVIGVMLGSAVGMLIGAIVMFARWRVLVKQYRG